MLKDIVIVAAVIALLCGVHVRHDRTVHWRSNDHSDPWSIETIHRYTLVTGSGAVVAVIYEEPIPDK